MHKNKYTLGGEQSGHIILGHYMSTGDGILAALKILELLSAKSVKASKMFNLYDRYPQTKTNIKIEDKMNKKTETQIKRIAFKYEKKYLNLRFLIRKSGTEPLLRILVEGKDKNIVKNITSKLLIDLKKIINA